MSARRESASKDNVLKKAGENFEFFSPPHQVHFPKSTTKKTIDTDPFISQRYKPVPEVFICYGLEDFYDLQPDDHTPFSKDYRPTMAELVETRKKYRSARIPYNHLNNRNENQKEIQKRRVKALKEYKF